MLPAARLQRGSAGESLKRTIVAAAGAVVIAKCSVGFQGDRSFAGICLGIRILAGAEVIRLDPKLDGLGAGDLQRAGVPQVHLIASAEEVKILSLQCRDPHPDSVATGLRHRIR